METCTWLIMVEDPESQFSADSEQIHFGWKKYFSDHLFQVNI